MTKASLNRYAKKAAGRKALALVQHIEALGAAFCTTTGLDPTEVILMSDKDDKGNPTYWYEKRADQPPAEENVVRYMFDLVRAIAATKDAAELGPIVRDCRNFMRAFEGDLLNENTTVAEETGSTKD